MFDGEVKPITAIDWDSDGKRILAGSQDGTFWVWDTESRKELLTGKYNSEYIDQVSWNQDGTYFLTGGPNTVSIRDTNTGEPLFQVKGQEAHWSSDGARLLVANDEGNNEYTIRVYYMQMS